jgi:hypothetical protein
LKDVKLAQQDIAAVLDERPEICFALAYGDLEIWKEVFELWEDFDETHPLIDKLVGYGNYTISRDAVGRGYRKLKDLILIALPEIYTALKSEQKISGQMTIPVKPLQQTQETLFTVCIPTKEQLHRLLVPRWKVFLQSNLSWLFYTVSVFISSQLLVEVSSLSTVLRYFSAIMLYIQIGFITILISTFIVFVVPHWLFKD